MSQTDTSGEGMRELVSVRWPHALAPMAEGDALLAMIERVARDPAVDLDRLERLLAARKEMVAENARIVFNDALAAAQAEMLPISADANNPQTKSKYATLPAVVNAVLPIYSKHGLLVTFDQGDAPKPEEIRILCFVAKGGHERPYHIDMPADGKGARGGDVMTKTHATGSAVSYGRRYLLGMIFNLVIDKDDDGNAGSRNVNGKPGMTAEQARDELAQLVAQLGEADLKTFYKLADAERIEDIPAYKLEPALDWLRKRVSP